MNATDNESLGTGAPSRSGDLGETASAREKANAAAAPDRVDEAAPQHADAGDPTRGDRSLDHGMASAGAASQAEASARHAGENLPRPDPKSAAS